MVVGKFRYLRNGLLIGLGALLAFCLYPSSSTLKINQNRSLISTSKEVSSAIQFTDNSKLHRDLQIISNKVDSEIHSKEPSSSLEVLDTSEKERQKSIKRSILLTMLDYNSGDFPIFNIIYLPGKNQTFASLGQIGFSVARRRNPNISEGVTISRVYPNSLFKKFGIKAGDTIVSLNGKVPYDEDDLISIISNGSHNFVEIEIVRENYSFPLNYLVLNESVFDGTENAISFN